jgi:hypothetical protein
MLERHTASARCSHLEANRMESPETEDRWYVNVGGSPKMMNLDQIVEAFEAGTINGKTLVTEVGGSEWKPLKEVADLGDDEEPAPPSVQVPAAAAPVVAPPLAGPGKSSIPPSVRATQPTQSGWPPVVAASRPPLSVAPARTVSQSPSVPPSGASPSLAPVSTMPMVQDLGLSLDADFKPRKSKAPLFAAAVVVVFIGGLFGVSRLTGGGEVTRPIPVPAAAPVAANTATSNTLTTPTPAPTTAPTPTSDSASSGSAASDKPASDKPSETASADARLADDVKAKLKDADKSRSDKKKATKASHAKVASRSKSSSSSSGVFRAGGNVNDPLNSKL